MSKKSVHKGQSPNFFLPKYFKMAIKMVIPKTRIDVLIFLWSYSIIPNSTANDKPLISSHLRVALANGTFTLHWFSRVKPDYPIFFGKIMNMSIFIFYLILVWHYLIDLKEKYLTRVFLFTIRCVFYGIFDRFAIFFWTHCIISMYHFIFPLVL